MIKRTILRIRRILDQEVTRLRRVPEALAIVAAAFVVIVVIRATATGADWAEILRAQAVNLLSAATFAGFAYVLFVLRFRRGQLSTYLERERAAGPEDLQRDEDLSALARTIVDELLDVKPPHAVLVIGSADARQTHLLSEVSERLIGKRRVPVAIEPPTTQAGVTLAALVRDRFVEALVGSSGDAQGARRLFAALVRKRRVVALVSELDRVGQGEPLPARRMTVHRLLEGSLAEGIPFVAWVNPDIAPSISEVAAFRTRPLADSQIVGYVGSQLESRGLADAHDVQEVLAQSFRQGETTRDPVLLSLFSDLLLRRTRTGEDRVAAARRLFADPCAFRRHLSWMSEWALDCSIDALHEVASPTAVALAALGREAHYRQDPEIRLDAAVAEFGADEKRRIAAGVAMLSHRRVVDVTPSADDSRIRFTHPTWLAFSGTLGLRLEERYWRDLLGPDAPSSTLDALTGALLTFGDEVLEERSFLRVLHRLGVAPGVDISLEMCLSVIMALQAHDTPLEFGPPEIDALERAWATEGDDDVVKTRFVSDVDFASDARLIEFLWRRVVPPDVANNSFRVRRAICSRLGRMGSATWSCLGARWQALLDAAGAADLSSWARKDDDWTRYGFGVAHLGWTLPGVLHTVEIQDRGDAFALLGQLRKVVGGEARLEPDAHPPEIGLEISLAEGFKIAAVDMSNRRETCGERWYAEAVGCLDASSSWISKQSLLQALGLVLGGVNDDRLEQLVGPGRISEREHPFVREAAALVRRAVMDAARPARLTERHVPLEDVEALADGGVDLSPAAHRLLGLTTLLINLAEWRFVAWTHDKEGSTEASVGTRQQAFTGTRLPKCFARSAHAATMFQTECDCPFKFCGRAAKKGVLQEARQFSRSFLQRAQATAGARALADTRGSAYAKKAFAPVWQELDAELAVPSRGVETAAPRTRRRRASEKAE